MNLVRVGFGYDVHRLVAGRSLVLGGVEIPSAVGLDGHSDADVLLHALCDALLGAAGKPDIGHFFPNTDERWRGVSSLVLLREVARIVSEERWSVGNVDLTLLAESPKIGLYIDSMKRLIAEALAISEKQCGIKATTNEGLGFVGRGEGMAAMAVVLLQAEEKNGEH